MGSAAPCRFSAWILTAGFCGSMSSLDSTVVAELIAGSFRAAQLEVVLLLVVFWLMVAKPGF